MNIKYMNLKRSIEGLQKIQFIKLPIKTVLDISKKIDVIENQLNIYSKSIDAINKQYFPYDNDWNIIYEDDDQTLVKIDDMDSYNKAIDELNNTIVELDLEQIEVKLDDRNFDIYFTINDIKNIEWLIKFI